MPNNEGLADNSPLLDSKLNPSNWRPGNLAAPQPFDYKVKQPRRSNFGLPPLGPKGDAS